MSPAPAHTHSPKVRLALALAASCLLSSGASAKPRSEALAAADQTGLLAQCAPAALHAVALGHPESVDEIRVTVHASATPASAASVRVDDGRFDRVVHLRGPGDHRLRFHPPLAGEQFSVAIDPVFASRAAACVEQIELVRRGTVVGTIVP